MRVKETQREKARERECQIERYTSGGVFPARSRVVNLSTGAENHRAPHTHSNAASEQIKHIILCVTSRVECDIAILHSTMIYRCRTNSVHTRQTRPDSDLGFQVSVLTPFTLLPIRSDAADHKPHTQDSKSCFELLFFYMKSVLGREGGG